jgi:hypothetical protein
MRRRPLRISKYWVRPKCQTTFHKIGTYLSRPEYKFQSKRVIAGMLYWVKLRV